MRIVTVGMYYIALALLCLGFLLLGHILIMLMFCEIVEHQEYNDSALYQNALKFVEQLGGAYRIRIFCWFLALPITLFIIFIGYALCVLCR